jgi:hypothetical protein
VRHVSAFPAVAASRPRCGCCRLRASAGMQGAVDDLLDHDLFCDNEACR